MMTMKFKNILMALGLGSMLMTSCTLDEEVYTFISGEDLSADGEYELLVNGAYQPLADNRLATFVHYLSCNLSGLCIG